MTTISPHVWRNHNDDGVILGFVILSSSFLLNFLNRERLTNQLMDKPFHRDAWMHLKICSGILWSSLGFVKWKTSIFPIFYKSVTRWRPAYRDVRTHLKMEIQGGHGCARMAKEKQLSTTFLYYSKAGTKPKSMHHSFFIIELIKHSFDNFANPTPSSECVSSISLLFQNPRSSTGDFLLIYPILMI